MPSAGASLFAYFFGVVKSMASDSTRTVGIDVDLKTQQSKTNGKKIADYHLAVLQAWPQPHSTIKQRPAPLVDIAAKSRQ